MIAPAPGQIWISRRTYSAFADVVETYEDGVGGGPIPKSEYPSDEVMRRSLWGITKVGYEPILQGRHGEITVLGTQMFLSNFEHVLTLHEWLPRFRSFNPGWSHPGMPEFLRLHQIWEVGSSNRYVRVTKPGSPGDPSEMMEYLPVGSVLTGRQVARRSEFVGDHRFCFNLLDVLARLREQITVEQNRRRIGGRA